MWTILNRPSGTRSQSRRKSRTTPPSDNNSPVLIHTTQWGWNRYKLCVITLHWNFGHTGSRDLVLYRDPLGGCSWWILLRGVVCGRFLSCTKRKLRRCRLSVYRLRFRSLSAFVHFTEHVFVRYPDVRISEVENVNQEHVVRPLYRGCPGQFPLYKRSFVYRSTQPIPRHELPL